MPSSRLHIDVLSAVSRASGPLNEDRGRAANFLAWVIDGATDVVETPLTSAGSDAAWLADFIDRELATVAAVPPPLASLPDLLARRAAAAFAASAARTPRERSEQPSASGLIVRATAGGLDYVAIGDCTLIAETDGGIAQIGVAEEDAGDKWLATAIAAFHERQDAATAEAARAHVWPRIRAVRDFMNVPGGYGVFSITPTPPEFIRVGELPMRAGSHALLASDGLMRLVDVFGVLDAAGMLADAKSRGIAALLDDVRRLELADPDCRTYPRAKISDDATGVLIRLAPGE